VQPFDEPYRIKFQVTDSRCWKPFFGKNNSKKFESIQPEKLDYKKTNLKDVNELVDNIERDVRDKIKEWRGISRSTRFQSRLNNILKKMLKDIEKNHNLKIQEVQSTDLEPILQTYRVSGFTLNMPYTTVDSIINAVKATQIHAIPNEDIEFGLGVHIHSYPNTILSVWVYLAVLFPKS
jgi:coiled-coil and C2 domain-containing protein 2A